ncbi:MAG: N-acetylmuramoyl-L-alanine amidase [Parachlamydiaceae bacterium]|nr:N-acetylmuramoyl-L-alanine amidase [Parachlamydiaceae bacterium]
MKWSKFALLLVLLLINSCTHSTASLQKIEEMSIPIERVNNNVVALAEPRLFPISKKLIVIDAGHGGEDFGTQSPFKPVIKEKNLNLVAANFLQGYLQQMGFMTAMTRKDDTFVSLDGRAEFANELKPALFVSVHFNSAPAVKAEGVEVFYYRSEQDKGRSAASKALAENILNRIIINTDANSRGVKHGDLAVIRKTNMPAVLVEGGFLTNESEYQKLKDSAYVKRLMWGIAQGIQKFTSVPSQSEML